MKISVSSKQVLGVSMDTQFENVIFIRLIIEKYNQKLSDVMENQKM